MNNKYFRLELLSVFVLLLSCSFPVFSQTFPDSTADRVLGQADFVTATAGTTQTSFCMPVGIALDTTVSPPILYISDYNNNRILGYYNYPFLQNNAPADFVIGQTDFISAGSGTTATSFNRPYGITVDSERNLWVADQKNNRVLVFLSPTTTDYTADYVFGQGGSFITADTNKGGVSESSLFFPENIAFDNQNRVYICDDYNHRILVFNDPLNTDLNADYVIGQPDFSSNALSTIIFVVLAFS